MIVMPKRLILFVTGVVGSLVLVSALAGSSVAIAQPAFDVSGIVYQDFNNSGSRQNAATFVEPLVNGIEVRAYDSANNLLACNRTGPTDCAGVADADPDGTYTLPIGTLAVGDEFRVEFINLPPNLQPGMHIGAGANGQGTTVQFFTSTGAAITTGDLPLTAIGTFCGPNPATTAPDLVTSCYVFGNQTANMPAVVLFNYNAGGILAYQQLLTDTEAGSVYGFAYHNLTDQIFFANYVRRHVGTTPNGGVAGNNLDTLYMYNRATDTLITFDMGTLTGASFGSDGRTPTWDFIAENDTTTPGAENNWDIVGKNGVGDVEISTDGSTLFVTNLFQRRIEIFTINYGTGSATGFTANPAAITLTHNGALTPPVPCTGGPGRPFALGYYNGSIYSGWLCTAETSNNPDDLEAYVFQGNTQVFGMELRFAATINHRGCVGGDTNANCVHGAAPNHYGDWNPWSSNFTIRGQSNFDPAAGTQISGPEPILSDIEFDNDGNMTLGFRDRYADMIGYNSLSNPGDATLYSSWSAGDMYHACLIGGVYVLEGSAGCPQNAANNDGPNGGEYYPGDNVAGGFHGEAYQGALAQVAGLPDVVTSAMDPQNVIFTGGFHWVNNTSGGLSKAATLFGNTTTTAGKGNGIGDIEPLCPPPEMEIGNYIWLEDARDGIQGTGTETTVAGILVELIDPVTGNVIATTTTDASGHYYFNSTSTWAGGNIPFWDANGNGARDANEPQGIMAFANYQVRVAASNFNPGNPLENYVLTDINVAGSTDPSGDTISDSSPLTVGVTTSAFGVNNHTIDFGFTQVPPTTTGGGGTGGGGVVGGAGGGGGGGTGGQPGNQGPAGPAQPIITVNPFQNFVSPGNPVDWLITVSNPTGSTITGASIILTVPGNLNLLGGTGNGGNVRFNGAGVVMALNPIPPGGSATLTLNTRAIRDLLAQNITLVAGLQLADGTIIFADGTVYRPPGQLPNTGASPVAAWRLPALLAVLALTALVLLAVRHTYAET